MADNELAGGDMVRRIAGVIHAVLNRDDMPSGGWPSLMNEAALAVLVSVADWRPLSDTAWLDGRDVVLFAHGMEVQARYCPGEWSNETPISAREYDGAVWSCFDDAFQIEIEEISHDPAIWCHGAATHWRELTTRPPDLCNQQGNPHDQ